MADQQDIPTGVTIWRLTRYGRINEQENATPSKTGKTWTSAGKWVSVHSRSTHRRAEGWTDDRREVIAAGLAFWESKAETARHQLENAKSRAGDFRGMLRKLDKQGGAS